MGEALDVYADAYLADYQELSDEESLYTYEIDIRNVSNEVKDLKHEQDLLEGQYILKDAKPAPLRANPAKTTWQLKLPAKGMQSIRLTVLYRNLELIQRKNEMKLKDDLCKDRAIIVRERTVK